MQTYPTFANGQRVFASRFPLKADGWTFDLEGNVTRRVRKHNPYDQPAYTVHFLDGSRALCPSEHLSDVAVSYPRLTWLEVLEARGLPRPRGF